MRSFFFFFSSSKNLLAFFRIRLGHMPKHTHAHQEGKNLHAASLLNSIGFYPLLLLYTSPHHTRETSLQTTTKDPSKPRTNSPSIPSSLFQPPLARARARARAAPHCRGGPCGDTHRPVVRPPLPLPRLRPPSPGLGLAGTTTTSGGFGSGSGSGGRRVLEVDVLKGHQRELDEAVPPQLPAPFLLPLAALGRCCGCLLQRRSLSGGSDALGRPVGVLGICLALRLVSCRCVMVVSWCVCAIRRKKQRNREAAELSISWSPITQRPQPQKSPPD